MPQRSIDGIIKPKKDIDKPTNGLRRLWRMSKLDKRALQNLGVVMLVIVISALVVFIYQQVSVAPNPVPLNVRSKLDFPIYYPVLSKLPKGYTLNLKSFSYPTKNVLVFSVDYASNNKITFSEQKKPSATEIQAFYADYMPLRNNYQTPVGQAEISAYNNGGSTLETVVSLPTNTSTWIIITAPPNINQNQLDQVLSAITS